MEGAWEWKGPVIRASGCAYGKFFAGKAVYVSKKWFPDFANFRRQGYDLDALYDDGYARRDDLDLWTLLEGAPLLTGELKDKGGYGKGGKKGFEGTMTRLQMGCYAVVSDFVYREDRNGRRYGWGVAQYTRPEAQLGKRFVREVYRRSPQESEGRVREHLLSLVGRKNAPELEKLLQRGRVTAG